MQISLYKRIDEELLDLAEVEVGNLTISYNDVQNQLQQNIDIPDKESQIVVNEIDSSWSPIVHNLVVEQQFSINNPSALFGQSGVTAFSNTIGIACHISSKTSHFQKTVHIDDIKYSTDKVIATFMHEFKPDNIGGIISLEFYFYLKNIIEPLPFQASIVGTNLMVKPLQELKIIIDGSGSEFPIVEINDPNQPLWRVEMTWSDVYGELFDTNSIRLILNQGHTLFDQLMNQRYRINQYLMNDIIISTMALVIQQAVLIEGNKFDDTEEYQPGSIAQVVWYWISTYNVNVESLDSIENSIRKNSDSFIGGNT